MFYFAIGYRYETRAVIGPWVTHTNTAKAVQFGSNEMVILGCSIDTENLCQYICLLCVISDRFLTICITYINMYLAGLHITCNYETVCESGYLNNIDSTNYVVVIFRYFMIKQRTA